MAALTSRRTWLIAALSVALVIALFVGGRAVTRLYFRLHGGPPPPRQTDVSAIADWMTLPEISRAYHIPEPELGRALGVTPENRRTRTLAQIASETGRDPDEVVGIVRETVSEWQAAHPDFQRPGRPKPEDATPSPTGQRAPPDSPTPGLVMVAAAKHLSDMADGMGEILRRGQADNSGAAGHLERGTGNGCRVEREPGGTATS